MTVGRLVAFPELRTLVPEDRPRIKTMTRAVGLFRDYEIDLALEVFDEATGANPAKRIDPDYETAGLVLEGRLMGWACWGPTPEQPGTFDLYWIVVDSSAQGQGLGTKLLGEMNRRVAGRARVVLVETSGRADYQATRSFYLRHGYRQVDRVPDHYAPGDDLIRFEKKVGA